MVAIITLNSNIHGLHNYTLVYLSRNISIPVHETYILSLYIPLPNSIPISANMNFTHPTMVQKHGSISTSGKFSLTTGGPQYSYSSAFTELLVAI